MTFLPSPSFNDLIGLEYDWGSSPSDGNGKTNCFAMCMEVRKRLGLTDFRKQFEKYYREGNPEDIGPRQIIRLLWKHGKKITEPLPGAIFYLPSPNDLLAMAVVIDSTNCLLLSPGGRVIRMPFAKVTQNKYYWAE